MWCETAFAEVGLNTHLSDRELDSEQLVGLTKPCLWRTSTNQTVAETSFFAVHFKVICKLFAHTKHFLSKKTLRRQKDLKGVLAEDFTKASIEGD